MHPLVTDLSDIRDEALSNRISDLTNKYFMTTNPDVKLQIQTILEIYKQEYYIRKQKELEESMKRLDTTLENLIKIKQ